MDPPCAETRSMSDGYLGDERLNQMARLCVALMREVWLLRDRQMVLEKLLAEVNVLDPHALEAFEPDELHEEQIRVEVDRLVARVFASTFRSGPPDLDELVRRVHSDLAAEARLRTGKDDE